MTKLVLTRIRESGFPARRDSAPLRLRLRLALPARRDSAPLRFRISLTFPAGRNPATLGLRGCLTLPVRRPARPRSRSGLALPRRGLRVWSGSSRGGKGEEETSELHGAS